MAQTQASGRGQSPEQEDRALFRTYGGPIEVELVPRLSRTADGDVIISGFFKRSTEISVLFPGRRAREIGPLDAHLRWIDSQARRAAVAARRPSPNPDLIRLPVKIKGAWRQRFWRDADDNETGIYQLVAARWAFTDQTGTLVQFGEAPAYDVSARQRPKSYILTAREIDAVPRSAPATHLE
ncbi:hypothetical protein [Roseobacter sinensis]|uniref:Lipoprotein n=1 Tax=Roseobacter sinensis TaxID=2931391 RepID=A0ABT3BDZ9_9RHOB|nr:hypothetical protein [Roseobacter sp. WL0113]MCV3271772.1 hypothetical protein [Roseobacter sp. WL0113]